MNCWEKIQLFFFNFPKPKTTSTRALAGADVLCTWTEVLDNDAEHDQEIVGSKDQFGTRSNPPSSLRDVFIHIWHILF